MAKLSTRFDLCRLIDLKSLLGVSEDSEPGCVIVTLGKNIVIRFKVSNFKFRFLYYQLRRKQEAVKFPLKP